MASDLRTAPQDAVCRPMTLMTRRAALASLFALSACGLPVSNRMTLDGAAQPLLGSPKPGTPEDAMELERAILALGPGVDPAEAERAARMSYEHTYRLALEYRIVDPALIHNNKVNLGLKPRGLCKHYAEDMERMLRAQDFQTLDVHRAIGAVIGIDHSTAIISRRGDDMYDGIVLDPWRRGGRLTWIPTREDTAWGWRPQFAVLDEQVEAMAREKGLDRVMYTVEDKSPRCLILSDPAVGAVRSTNDLSRCMGVAPVSIGGAG